jgi:CBS domain containing-hemolysin-like protein
MTGFQIFTIAVCLALSFLLSGMEAGVFALNRVRIRQLMRRGRPAARLLHGYLANTENFLWTILVGNTLVSFLALGVVYSSLFMKLNDYPLLFLAAFALVVFCFYAFADLLPKMLFRTYPNRLTLSLVQPFRLIHLGLAPLVSLMELGAHSLLRWTGGRTFAGHVFGNRDELRFVMQESSQAFTSEERAMISRVLDLPNLTVGQITRPLATTITTTVNTPMSRVLELCREHELTRLPVFDAEGGQRRIVGLVSLRSVFYSSDFDAKRLARDYVTPAVYLDAGLRLDEALRRMQRAGQRLAIVLGADRREAGILSVQDILNVMFGEVQL